MNAPVEQARLRRESARYFLMILLLSAAASFANKSLAILANKAHTGLWLDTAFVITAVFSGGLEAGMLTSFFTTALSGVFHQLFLGRDYYWGSYIYGLCFAATALVAWLFSRSFPEECASLQIIRRRKPAPPFPSSRPASPLDRIIMLSLLSMSLWIVISVMGALISLFNYQVLHAVSDDIAAENIFKLGLLQRGFGFAVSELLTRIPINIIDRPVSVFIGYGTSLLLKKLFGRFRY
jgi:hypothetical protein